VDEPTDSERLPLFQPENANGQGSDKPEGREFAPDQPIAATDDRPVENGSKPRRRDKRTVSKSSRSGRRGSNRYQRRSEDLEQAWIDKSERQEFFLPLNGFVWFYFDELKVINHPAFQRLSLINQLGQAHYVFRGATHKRIEHVLGAVDVVQRMISAVALNAQKSREFRGEADWRAPLSPREQRFVRLGALLHDIGHVACGHTLEDELCLFGKHDEDERLLEVYNRTDWGTGRKETALAELIDTEFGRYVPKSLAGCSASQIVRMLTRKDTKDASGQKPVRKRSATMSETPAAISENQASTGTTSMSDEQCWDAMRRSSDIRTDVCTSMIGNTICADLLDYIYRDWYHVGKLTLAEDRIYQYMEIRHPENPDCPENDSSRRDSDDKFVIALGEHSGRRPRIRTDAVSAILGLLERRYELGETVLYHRTKLAAGAMLGRALYELWVGQKPKKIDNTILQLSDEQLLEYALTDASSRLKKNKRDTSALAAQTLLYSLKGRRIYDPLYSVRHWSIIAAQRDSLTELFFPSNDRTGLGARRRTDAARQLETDFDLPKGSLVMSLTNVKPKIAEVLIRVNKQIDQFNKYEDKHGSRGLSGGHLNAQIRRFRDLWRLDFFMDCNTLTELEEDKNKPKLNLLMDAIEDIFVNPPADPSARDRTVQRIAISYQQWKNGLSDTESEESASSALEASLVTARSHQTAARNKLSTYPNGIRTISSFMM
jgi:HD superfamily phosphohydrolase